MMNVPYLILIAAVFAAFLFSGSVLCLFAGIILAAVPFISVLIVRLILKRVVITLNVPAVAEKNKKFEVSVSAENTGRIPIGMVSYILCCSNRLTGEIYRRRFTGIHEKAIVESRYCGCIDITLEKVRIYDWFGIFALAYKEDISGRIVVMPDTFAVEAGNSITSRTFKDTEEYSQIKKGQDRSETFRIRDYEAGDPLSQIHWKLSSKLGSMMIREASLPVDHSLVIFWDRTADKKDPSVEDALFEAVSSVGSAFAEAGVPFTFVWNGESLDSYDVAYSTDLPEALMTMQKAALPLKGISAAELFYKFSGNMNAGKILYFTRQVPEDISLLTEEREVILFNCSRNGSAAAAMENEIDFTPENVGEVFTRIILN